MNSTSLNWRKRSPIADYFMPSNFQFSRNFSTYDAMGRWDDVTMIMRPILNVRVYSWQICQCANKNFPIMIACCQVTTAKQRIAKKILIAFSIVFILETTQCNSSCTSLVHHSFSSTFLQWSLSQFFSHKKFTISQIRRHSHSAHKKYPYCPKKRRSAAVFLCAFRLTSFSQSLLFLWIFCFFLRENFFCFILNYCTYTQCVNGIMPPIIASSRRGNGLHCFCCDRAHFVAFKILIMHYHRVLPTHFKSIDDSLHLLILPHSFSLSACVEIETQWKSGVYSHFFRSLLILNLLVR